MELPNRSLDSAETAGGEIVDAEAAIANYVAVYTRLGLAALAVAAILYLLSPLLEHFMRGAESCKKSLIARLYRRLSPTKELPT